MPGAPDLPVYRCLHVETAAPVDGNLARQPWTGLERIRLRQADGRSGTTLRTEAAAFWTSECLYIGFWCEDSYMWATMMKRDDKVWREEAVEFFLQPDPASDTYFEFQISPANILRDIRVQNRGDHEAYCQFAGEWDATGIQTAVLRSGPLNQQLPGIGSWNVEVAVPFRAVGVDPRSISIRDERVRSERVRSEKETRWRVNLFRTERRPQEEYQSWSPTLTVEQPNFHVPSRFGYFEFVK